MDRRWPRRRKAGVSAAEAGIVRESSYELNDWFDENLRAVSGFFRRAFQLLQYNDVPGDYAEFGCMGATTFTLAHGAANLVGHGAHLWAFDSFAGLPAIDDPRDVHRRWNAGSMAMSESDFHEVCARRGIPRDRYTTVAGYYSESLSPQASGPRPDLISFAYVDCDLYTSTVDVLGFLRGRIQHGTVIAFDDYYCVGPSTASGERLAAMEFSTADPEWELVPYVQYGWHGMSFVVHHKMQPGGAWSH